VGMGGESISLNIIPQLDRDRAVARKCTREVAPTMPSVVISFRFFRAVKRSRKPSSGRHRAGGRAGSRDICTRIDSRFRDGSIIRQIAAGDREIGISLERAKPSRRKIVFPRYVCTL